MIEQRLVKKACIQLLLLIINVNFMIMISSARDCIPILNVYKLSEFQNNIMLKKTAETAANNLSASRLLRIICKLIDGY